MKSTISFKDINKLAIPAIFAGISESIISLTDIAIVGNVKENSVEALAAVGLVGSFLSAIIWIVAQTKTSISAAVSQHLGANRIFAVKTLVPQAILFNFILSILLFLFTTFFVNEIFTAYNAEGLLLTYAKEYYLIRAWGFPLTLITFALYGVFRGLQNTIWAMKCSLTGAIINVILTYFFVFGIDGLLPAMHIKGAAYASVIAQSIMLIMAFYYFFKYTPFNLALRKTINPSLKPLIIMSFNFIIRTATLNVAIYLANAYATGYGKNYIAAQSILMNIWLFFSFFIDGYASAGNALSGRLLGEKNYNALWKMSKDISKYAIIIAIILIAICLAFYKQIGLLFNQETEVIKVFVSVFWLVLIMQPINALAYIYDGIFKGMGDAKFLRNNLLFATFCGFIPTLLLFDYLDFKLYSVWLAFAVWMCCRSFPLMYIFKKNFVDK
ncbi:MULTISPECIES: MATE family efflux transporter [Myroides]|uniref:Multidrug-efflux transporter n=1 Tax=Myroides albus TaxID=2562892 RepID=A0A6I3LHA9_9FLAO|nr:MULTISPECIES: MATE family efflux transporter [Myroides]MTG98959.1 MATE family efflux transporter [Myroides albus]MVX34351.1 MATE family efflux transporter [Myroides sp. LoEW2-1]UVD78573.1 MATE family efflux transporter [Myroides albus]